LNQISKITLISDLHSYKGCLSVERPRTLGGKRKKETSVEKIIYLRSHYVRAEVVTKRNSTVHMGE